MLFLAAGVSLAALVGRTSFQKQSAGLLLLLRNPRPQGRRVPGQFYAFCSGPGLEMRAYHKTRRGIQENGLCAQRLWAEARR